MHPTPTEPGQAELERAVGRLLRRVRAAAFLGELARHLVVVLLVGGCVALCLRFFLELPRERAGLALAALFLAPLSAWLRTRRRLFSPAAAATWLDVQSGGTGRIVTGLERPDGRWLAQAERSLAGVDRAPRLRVTRLLSPVAPALAFALLSIWIGLPRPAASTSASFVESAARRIEEKLATLEETVAVDDELAAELRAALERLERESAAAGPEASFEALDRVESRLESEALEALEAARDGNEALSRANEAVASSEEGTSASNEGRELLQEALSGLLEEGLLNEDSGSFSELSEASGLEGLEGLEGAQLPADLGRGEMLELSQEMRELLASKMGDLAEAGLLDPSQLASLGDLSSFDLSDLEFSELEAVGHECDVECEAGGT